MLLGTCSNRDISVAIQGEDKLLDCYLEQDVSDEKTEESDVVIVARHVQRLCHALYLCVANVGAVEESEPGELRISIQIPAQRAVLTQKMQPT
jgi:hypothetical protein